MKNAMTATAARTVPCSRLLLALAVALVLGSLLAQDMEARKSNLPVSKKVGNLRELCEGTGGTFSTESTKRGTKYTTCNEADGSTTTCTATKKAVSCHVSFEAPPESGPAIPPTNGVVEEPPGGGGSGGKKAGGGAAVRPGGKADAGGSEPPIIQ